MHVNKCSVSLIFSVGTVHIVSVRRVRELGLLQCRVMLQVSVRLLRCSCYCIVWPRGHWTL